MVQQSPSSHDPPVSADLRSFLSLNINGSHPSLYCLRSSLCILAPAAVDMVLRTVRTPTRLTYHP